MKIVRRILRVLGILALLLLIVAGIVIYRGWNYPMYPLKAKANDFPGVHTQAQIDSLSWALIAQMSLDEKLEQISGEPMNLVINKFVVSLFMRNKFPHVFSGRNARLHIPPFVLSDGPRGAVVGDGPATCYPVAMARAASWNPALEKEIADAVGQEMRAMGTNYSAAPCINLLRHPAWGRAQETYGEDPWLMGEMGVAFVQGVQTQNVMACPKHFALNSVENARFYIDVKSDLRTLNEVYFPHFKKVIQEGNAASIMSAYNLVNGDHCGENSYLLDEVLRKDWGFEGFVTTDWFQGLYDGVKGARAGQNGEMPAQVHFGKELKKAVEAGTVPESRIDTLVYQVLRTKLRFALATDPMTYDASVLASEAHIALARQSAAEGMVLLKNEGVLPFENPKGKIVAVIGHLADTVNTGDEGSSYVRKVKYVVTPLQGIRDYVESRGGKVIFSDGKVPEAAKKIASSADAVVIVAGFTRMDEGEYINFSMDQTPGPPKAGQRTSGGDRDNLRLKSPDEALIKTVSAANKPTVVALVGGSAIVMENWKNEVPAILMAWYGGMEGGHALADLLFGEVNPSGKLPFTIPVNESDLPAFDPFAESLTYGYYHGYTLFDKKQLPVAFPFGFGLSYTSLRYDSLRVLTPALATNDTLTVTVSLTNTGTRSGTEVAQLYVGFPESRVDRPVKLLRAFARIALSPGETRRLALRVPVRDLAWYNPDTKAWEVEKVNYRVYVGKDVKEAEGRMAVFGVE